MAANGYGYGNLPMDLYKMCIHDNWAPAGERADGQGDYTSYGIFKIKIYFRASTKNGRDIISPQGFVDHITGCSDYEVVYHDGDQVTYSDKGGAAITELTDGGTFFVKEIGTNVLYL